MCTLHMRIVNNLIVVVVTIYIDGVMKRLLLKSAADYADYAEANGPLQLARESADCCCRSESAQSA